MKRTGFLNIILALIILSACTMEPKYVRPQVDLPFRERDQAKPQISTISWRDYFKSEDMQRVIELALDNNRDLRVASLNVESVEANYAITRSSLFPTINTTALETRQGVPRAFASFTPRRQYRANIGITNYEVDFFGRLRSLKKSAMEDYLASSEAKEVARISLITQTANAYAQYLLDSQILEIAEENLAAQQQRINFTQARYNNGIDSKDTLLGSEISIETAINNREVYAKLVEQDKNNLMLLTGTFSDEALPKMDSVNEIEIDEDLLSLVPSESLLLRPDIVQAEHQLKSANANIGAARAAFFPSITLTSTYGYGTTEWGKLFRSKSWVFTPQINLPIFTGGKNMANLKLSNVRKKSEIAQYEKTIQTAFREVLDELAERKSVSNQLKSYDKILNNRKKSYEIADVRHKHGINSALNNLDIKIAYLTALQNQATTKKEYIANLITLYKAMGGGSEVLDDSLSNSSKE